MRITIAPAPTLPARDDDAAAPVPPLDDALLVAQVERLYAGVGVASASAFAGALITSVLLFDALWELRVFGWASLLFCAQAAQLGLLLAYRRGRVASAPARARLWRERLRVALAVHALVWAFGAWLWLPALDATALGFSAFALGGVMALGVPALASDRGAVAAWLAPPALVIPAALAMRGGTGPLLALVAFGGFVLCAKWALVQYAAFRKAFDAERAHHALVERLHDQLDASEQASRDKSRFLAAASHDLRQPLHALSFFGATLERHMTGSTDEPLIYNMMRSIEALDKSFGAILDISRLDAQAVEPHVQSFPIGDLFRRLQMNFAGRAEEAGLQLRFKPGGKVVRSDPQLLERILGNLIQNALRYSRTGGVVVLARNWQGGINVEVWDSGIGIPEDELPKIFGEFYQVSNPERDRAQGLGMGLAIVRRLTLLLGHTLTVQSRPGRGSVFRLWIEGSNLDSVDGFTVAAETVPSPIDEARTVLIVDDEETIRASVGQLLSQWGYTVLTAATVDEARDVARKQEGFVDIVVSDLRLRNHEDGIQAIERVRQVCGFAVPAVLVTGDTAAEEVRRVHESGHVVMFKPVQPKELLNVLRRLS